MVKEKFVQLYILLKSEEASCVAQSNFQAGWAIRPPQSRRLITEGWPQLQAWPEEASGPLLEILYDREMKEKT